MKKTLVPQSIYHSIHNTELVPRCTFISSNPSSPFCLRDAERFQRIRYRESEYVCVCVCVCERERGRAAVGGVLVERVPGVTYKSVCMVICRWTVWWTFCPCCVTVQLNRRVQSSRTTSIDKQQSTQIQSSVIGSKGRPKYTEKLNRPKRMK